MQETPEKVGEMHEKVPRFGIRHVMAILLHTFLICISLTRVSMSWAIVAMTDSSASSNPDIPWASENKRSLLALVAESGVKTGFIAASLSTGFISASPWGWPGVFYILGAVCLVWCVLWAIFASESPSTHSMISEAEKRYIEGSLRSEESADIRPIPFKNILTSAPFWALAVANAGVSWTLTINDTQIPLYLSKALGFDVASNGAASASPAVLKILINIPWAFLGDFWVSRGCISLWTWRRINQSLSSYIPFLVLIWLGFLTKEQSTLAVILLNIQAISAVKLFGSLINHVDLSPRYAGVLMGLENTLGQVIAMFAPIFNQLMVADLTDVTRWRSMFLSLAAVELATGTVFILMGSAEVQWWNSKIRKNEE